MMIFSVKNLSCGYHGHALVDNINFTVESGEVVCILGPNGIGKTTFFKTAQGFLKPLSGRVCIDEISISQMTRSQLAHHIAYVPQAQGQAFSYSVYDMILMGRASFIKHYSSPSRSDHAVCERIISELNIEYLKDKLYTQISGGEKQLVLIARALVQEPKLLMLDEPTSNLDFGNQIIVLRTIHKLSEQGISILMITHSPDHALVCADKVIMFSRNGGIIVGSPENTITEESLKKAYGVDVKIAKIDILRTDGNDEPETRMVQTCVPIL